MNARLMSRPHKPILGSGDGEEDIFAVSGGEVSFSPLPLPWLPLDWPVVAPGISFLPGAEQPETRHPSPSIPAQATAPATAAPPPLEASVPTRAASPPPSAPPETIVVERIGPLAIRVTGTDRGDHLSGGPGDDRLDGSAGNDILLGSPGRDLLHGGPGHDTIRYDLLRAEVSLDTRFQRISLEDGEDQYDGIEVIDLRDGDWILTAGAPAGLVQRLWLAATDHAPSAAEMIRETAALQAGGTAEALAQRLAGGAGETVRLRVQAALDAPREGKLDQPVWLPDFEALQLSRLCELALGGAPDRDAFLNWLDGLEAGRSLDAVAADVVATPLAQAFAPTAEAQALAEAARMWML